MTPLGSGALDWNTDGADWPLRRLSVFVETDTHRWHVQRTGAGPGVLLLHGAAASTHSFAPLMEKLAPQFDVLAVDLPGHAFTKARTSKPISLPYAAQAVRDLLGALKFEPQIIVGHSAGAAVMIRSTLDTDIDPALLISINGALEPFEGAAGLVFPIMAKMLYYNPFASHFFAWSAQDRSRVKTLISQTGSNIAEDQIDLYARLLRSPRHVAGALAMMANWDLPGLMRDMPDLKAPSLFLAGEKDAAVPPGIAGRAATALSAEHEVLTGLGHLAHEEDPQKIASIIRAAAAARGLI